MISENNYSVFVGFKNFRVKEVIVFTTWDAAYEYLDMGFCDRLLSQIFTVPQETSPKELKGKTVFVFLGLFEQNIESIKVFTAQDDAIKAWESWVKPFVPNAIYSEYLQDDSEIKKRIRSSEVDGSAIFKEKIWSHYTEMYEDEWDGPVLQ